MTMLFPPRPSEKLCSAGSRDAWHSAMGHARRVMGAAHAGARFISRKFAMRGEGLCTGTSRNGLLRHIDSTQAEYEAYGRTTARARVDQRGVLTECDEIQDGLAPRKSCGMMRSSTWTMSIEQTVTALRHAGCKDCGGGEGLCEGGCIALISTRTAMQSAQNVMQGAASDRRKTRASRETQKEEIRMRDERQDERRDSEGRNNDMSWQVVAVKRPRDRLPRQSGAETTWNWRLFERAEIEKIDRFKD
ncbi:hypothetical protein BV20DRAFT_979576 [Pilatotrama ljubarskyi]|nr:hypothetical protein BV20DRAFT_979576 [Pilatotrama ljubarskyi]